MTAVLGTFNILFVLGIPLMMIVFFILRVFLKSNFRPKWQFGLWIFWAINIVSLLMIGMNTAKDFQHGEERLISDNSFEIPSDTLLVEMEDSPFRNSWFRIGDDFLISDNDLVTKSIDVYFERSSSGRLEIVQKNESRGFSLTEAEELAGDVNYEYTLDGNRLILPSHFTIPEGDKWRVQEVKIYIRVPEGMYVERNRELSRNISWVEEDEQYSFPSYRRSHEMAWLMGAKGMVAPAYIADYKREYNLRGFSKIRVEGDFELNVKQGNRFYIRLGESNEQDRVEITKTGDRLNVYSNARPDDPFYLEITMPSLNELWAIESNDIDLKDFKQKQLNIVNEGEGDITVYADVQKLDVHLTGENELDIRGEGQFLEAILSDEASLDAEFFTVEKARIDLDNGSLARVSATDTLWRRVLDSELISRRDPVIIEKN